MSVICQNFVQNAWKKDLCSNCFKSVGDHESIDVAQNGENSSSDNSEDRGRYTPQPSNSYTARNETTPHTTWKTLISERNNKNSQPFKLENGFQGRLLTINKALNGTDKQNKGEAAKDRTKKPMNGISLKSTKVDFSKQTTIKSEGLNQVKKHVANGNNLSNGQGKVNYNNQKNVPATASNKLKTSIEENNNLAKKKALDKKPIQAKITKSEGISEQKTPLQSILKKSTSAPLDSGSQARRGSNVGFKDEEPLVIGFGGRDFSPEELEWEMASSDGETENGCDSLDETEDDKVFSKITKQNTEYNSDNANLLQIQKDKSNKTESTKPLKKTESPNAKTVSKCKENGVVRKTDNKCESPSKISENMNQNSDVGYSNGEKNAHALSIDKTEDCDSTHVKKSLTGDETVRAESKGSDDSVINVAMSNDKGEAEKPTVVKATDETPVTGVDVKNNSEFINEAASPPSGVDAQKKTESGEAVMFSDGAETTWQGTPSAEGNAEWQNGEEISGQILQAINTSLTNRHKMREDPGFSESIEKGDDGSVLETESENEANKISVSVNNGMANPPCDTIEEDAEDENDEQAESMSSMQPRESFLHGVASKPNAIYGPASDLFVSRSNSSSSSSSDEHQGGKGQISLSINVRVNRDDSQQCKEANDSDNDENGSDSSKDECVTETVIWPTDKTKPEIPAKPVKQFSPEKYKSYDKSHATKTTMKEGVSNFTVNRKDDNLSEVSYYSSVPDRSKTSITLVDAYAESNIYQEVNEKDLKIQDTELSAKIPGRESKLAALAIELEQVRHTNTNTKRQAPAPPKVPDPPMEDPPSCAGRASPVAEAPHSFPTYRGESMGFSSASSTTSTSSQDTETGYTSWNLHGDSEDHPKHSKSKSSFLLTQYSKCKMLAMGYAEDGAKARKRFSIKKLLKIGKEAEPPVTFDPNCPNPKAWKYSDHFERPRAKLEIIHPMDLENKSVTVNPGFESLHSNSMSSFSPNVDDSSFRNSVSSDYGSFYSDTLSPAQDVKQDANYEYIQPRQPITEENEESCSKAGTSSSTSPTPSRSSTASQASTVTSGSSKNGAAPPHRPPKPPPPPRAHSLLPGNKVVRNSDGTFKFPNMNGDTSSSDEVTVSLTKPQAPKRQCKSAIIRTEYTNLEEQSITKVEPENTSPNDTFENNQPNDSEEENNSRNTSSIQITQNDIQINCNEKENHQIPPTKDDVSTILQKSDGHEDVQIVTSTEGVYDNLEPSKEPKIQTSITIKTNVSSQKEMLSRPLSRNKNSPVTKAPARPPPIYSKPQSGNFPKNTHPWKTLEDSYLALTSSNRELLIKLVNQALKKRKNYSTKLNKFQFHWTDFEIDASQPSSVFAFGEKIAYHATMPQYPEYSLTLVVAIQQQSHLQENSEIKYPLFGKFTDYIPSELLDNSYDTELESMPATILVLDRSNILTIECFSESLPESLTEENEKELCFITLQLIQSLKSLQAQGIESIDTNCQNVLLAKTKHDRYHTLVFFYDICYEESDYSSDSSKISLCQYTLMLLFQMLKIQAMDDCVLTPKFSSTMSQKVFETAFSMLSEEKAVSLSQTKTLFECYLWGVTKVMESLQNSDDCDNILHRWLDIERSNCIKCIVNEESNDINIQNEYYSQFLIRTNVRNIREVASYL